LDLARFREQLVDAHRYLATSAAAGGGKRKRRPRSKAAVM
jgi:hypothetical protein